MNKEGSLSCQNFLFYIFNFNFYVRRMGRYMVPHVIDNSPLGSWGLLWKIQSFKTDHIQLAVAPLHGWNIADTAKNSIQSMNQLINAI